MTITDIEPQDTPTIDEAKVEAFLGQVVTDFAGAAATVMTIVGDRLGLFQALTGAGPTTAAGLAESTGLNPRLVVEWLAAQTVSGYVTYDPAAGTYELPVEHAAVLSIVDSPAYIVGIAEVVAGQYTTLTNLEKAFRGGGGIDLAAFPSNLYCGIERYFRTAYVHQLADVWFPAVEGLVERLGRGIRVADVGCGHGVATLLMAATWPASTFYGLDFHEPSVLTARAKAVEAGSPSNVSFHVGDAARFSGGTFDAAFFFDSLHDLGDPLAALRRVYGSLADGGVVVAVEPWSLDRLEDGIGNPTVRLGYSNSVSLCTPGSLAQPGAYGLGTQGGPAKRLELLRAAGFRDAKVVADTGHNLVFAAFK
jgi:SAM-dependent methyltransferase